MRIAVDCRFAVSPHGLGRYTRELVSELVRLGGAEYHLIVRSGDHSWIPRDRCTVSILDVAHYTIREQFALPRLLRRLQPDLLFATHFNIPFFCPVPCVVTIHDLILHRFPNDASSIKQFIYRRMMKRAVRASRSIIAVSTFVRNELSQTYGKSIGSKVTVIAEGVNPLFHPRDEEECRTIREKYGLHRPFFLYVGSLKQHKNIPLLVRAFLSSKTADELVLVTGGKELEHSPLPSHPQLRVLTNVSDDALPALYSSARAFVSASLYEGFGLPIAEALACGCPVIAANCTAIPETAHGHAMLLEPTVQAFSQAFRNPPDRSEAFVAGTWEAAAAKTQQVLFQNHPPRAQA